MKLIFTIIFGLTFSCFSFANHPKIDSLKTKLAETKVDSIKVNLYNKIASEFIKVNYDSILPYAQKASNLSSKINFPVGKALALKNQSIYYFYAGNQVESINRMQASVNLLIEIDNDLELAKTYQSFGILFKNQGESTKALEKFELAVDLFQKAGNLKGQVDNLINCGNVYQNQAQLDKALDYFDQAKTINKDLNDLNLEASILSGEGLIAEKQGNFDMAIQKLEACAILFEELEDTRNVLGTYNNLANISRKQGNYLNAVQNFEKALALAEEMNNPRLQAIILNNLANIYLDINDDDRAASLYRKAISITKNIDKSTYASLLSNLAIIQTRQKQYKEALKSLDSSLAIYNEQGNQSYLANTLFHIADNHFQLNNVSKAKQYYYDAKRAAEMMGDKYTSLFIYQGLAEIHLNQKELDSAFYYSNKAFIYAKENEVLPEASSASELLYRIYKAKGNYTKALELLETHTKLNDSLFDQEKSKALGKLEAELEFKNLKEQLELERKNEILENEVKVNQKENYITALSISLLALIAVIFLLLKIRKEKIKTNLMLSKKNLEISHQNKQLYESNLQKSKLFSIISHDLRSPVNSLSQIFEMYKANQITEEEFNSWMPEISKNLNSTRLMIDNLLSWAGESLNESQIDKKHIDVKAEVDELKDFFHTLLKEKKITLQNKIDHNFQAYMDPNAMKLVLRNLVSNAIKFCNPEDSIIISATTQEGLDRVCVQDTGVGMPADAAKKLFTDANISSIAGTHQEPGKGIGTVLCKTFVEENNGKIWVDYSEEGKGTRICFEIPTED